MTDTDAQPALRMFPGGEVGLPRGGTGSPSVTVVNDDPETDALQGPRWTVTVALPAHRGLLFGSVDTLQLMNGNTEMLETPGILSPDGQTFTFEEVNLGLRECGSQSVMWVSVSASDDADLGPTQLMFTIGDQQASVASSPSSSLNITE